MLPERGRRREGGENKEEERQGREGKKRGWREEVRKGRSVSTSGFSLSL